MNKKRNFAKLALLGALLCGLASPTFVGCKDYDDDIKDLQEQITSNKKEIDDILQKIKDGQYVQKVETVAEGIKITLGSGDVVTIKMGLMEQMGPMVSMEFLRCCISRLSMA